MRAMAASPSASSHVSPRRAKSSGAKHVSRPLTKISLRDMRSLALRSAQPSARSRCL